MNSRTILLWGFILAKFILQYFLYNTDYNLHRDEYLHLDQASHLAWGFVSVPPVTSWISYLIQLLGNSVFWIKFFPALFGALTIYVVWKTIEMLRGNLYALILGATCMLLSVLLRINFLYQPNSLDILCWTAFYYCVVRYTDRYQPRWLYAAALVFALGFLNKYNILFLLIGLLPGLLLTEQRRIFKQKEFYLAVVLALLLISPNLYWQYQNHFPVIHHMRLLTATQLVHMSRWTFIREQFFYFVGALPVLIAALAAFVNYKPFFRYRFFIWAFLFTLGTFIYLHAKGYYAIGLYPIYIAFGAVYLGEELAADRRRHLRWMVLALPVIFYVLLYHVFYSIESPPQVLQHKNSYQRLGLLRWEDGKDYTLPQDFADMLGWKELAAKVETAYNRLPKNTSTLVLCDNYGQAGAINYYVKNKNIRAVSFNADYINWFDLQKETVNLIRVKEYEGSLDEYRQTSPFFKQGFVADSVAASLAREYRTKIFVFTAANTSVNKKLRAEIEKERWH